MGANTSVVNKELFKKNVTDASTKILTTDEKFSSTTQQFDQTQKLTLSGVTVDCGFSAIQDMKVETKVINQIDSESELNLANQLRDQMEAILNNSIDQSQSGINLLQFNTTVENTAANQETINDMSTNIARKIAQSVNTALQTSQSQEFDFVNTEFKCPDVPGQPGILLRQNMDVRSVIENSLASLDVSDVVNEGDTLTFVESESEVVQENAGIFNGGIIAAFVLLGIVGIVIGGFVYWKKPWKKKKNSFGRKRKKRRRN